MSAPFQFVVPGELVDHLNRALGEHIRWCRRQHVPVPDGLAELWKWATFVARGLPLPDRLPEPDDGGMANEPLLLSVPQTADLLGCGETKVKRLIAQADLPVVMFEGVRRVRRCDLDDYLDRLASAGHHPIGVAEASGLPPDTETRSAA